jgi:hypothetical protein
MHYGSSYFSKQKGKPTLVAKMKGEKIGQRKALSQTDCLKINELYGCLDDVKLVSNRHVHFPISIFIILPLFLGEKILYAMQNIRNLKINHRLERISPKKFKFIIKCVFLF